MIYRALCRRARSRIVLWAHDKLVELELAARAVAVSRATGGRLTYKQAKFWLLFHTEREILRRIIRGDLL